MTFLYDFDSPEQWVGRFLPTIQPASSDIASEILRQREWDHSGLDVRAFTDKPPTPHLDRALAAISKDFLNSEIRVFHATRLVDKNSVLDHGLWALNRARQVKQTSLVVSKERQTVSETRLTAWSNWTEDNDPLHTKSREGDCWLVPTRHLLHDGGLDLMFARIGGEFMERISDDPYEGVDSYADPGQPYVVVATIPVSWCVWSPDMGAKRILFEVLKNAGQSTDGVFDDYWDVQVGQDIPPGRIEGVLDRHDAAVTA